jgi:hypothetical protein
MAPPDYEDVGFSHGCAREWSEPLYIVGQCRLACNYLVHSHVYTQYSVLIDRCHKALASDTYEEHAWSSAGWV